MPDQAEQQVPRRGGLDVDDFLEREAGGVHHIAMVLSELGSSAECGRAEFEYDKTPEGVELHRLCAALDDYLKGLSILPTDGTLTRWRRCGRCGGAGKWGGDNPEDPCTECGGIGATHAEDPA